MINSSSFIRLPCTPDLTEAGIAYALRSLPYSFDRIGGKPYDRLRRLVAGVAVELAFRRFLSRENIPYDVKGAAPFTEPEKYNVTLGGLNCDIKSFLISHRDQISQIRSDRSVILNAPALVPSEHQSLDGYSDHDLYLFAFLAGLIAASQDDLKRATQTGQPHYLIHVMPDAWRKPSKWNPLGRLVLKSESDAELLAEISGQDQGRGFMTRTVNLPPQKRILVNDPFFSISTVHVRNLPSARLGIHCASFPEAHIIPPLEWGNIWVYGMDILLAGFITRGEFRQRAKPVPLNARVFQYEHTKTRNNAVPISELKPLDELLTRVREWDRKNHPVNDQ
ncbi:MAG: hypothetical protein K8S20_11470 [Chloroflexi bacterium]|nr:hypothetical protein [Chloroflexota bacterium]